MKTKITSFKDFVNLKENNDWKAESVGKPLVKGFIPPKNLRPIIRAFLNSDKLVLMHDTGQKPVAMPKKSLYLVGGPVRDFVKGKSIKDLDLATNATPAQIALILSSAGFRQATDQSGRGGEDLHLPHNFYDADGNQKEIQDAKEGDKLVWYVKGRDNSDARKVFVIGAKVDGEDFDIATFRKDAKVEDGKAAVDFTDNPKDDADRRDLTINSLYILLDKPDSENKTLYDPTGHGQYDLENGKVRTVGKAEDRFQEDPLRVQRAIRFHCKFSKDTKLDPDIEKAIPKFLNLDERIAPDRIRSEFIKGLTDPDVDIKKYLDIYHGTKLLNTVFPGVKFDLSGGIPPQFNDKKDKVLALAWVLQHNSTKEVEDALSSSRMINGDSKDTGWQNQERSAVLFLLKLKEFSPDKVSEYMRQRSGTGLTNRQITDWVEMFHKQGQKSVWGTRVKTFASHQPSVTWPHAQAAGKDKCPFCQGAGCVKCKGRGTLPEHMRGDVIGSMEADVFKSKLDKEGKPAT